MELQSEASARKLLKSNEIHATFQMLPSQEISRQNAKRSVQWGQRSFEHIQVRFGGKQFSDRLYIFSLECGISKKTRLHDVLFSTSNDSQKSGKEGGALILKNSQFLCNLSSKCFSEESGSCGSREEGLSFTVKFQQSDVIVWFHTDPVEFPLSLP